MYYHVYSHKWSMALRRIAPILAAGVLVWLALGLATTTLHAQEVADTTPAVVDTTPAVTDTTPATDGTNGASTDTTDPGTDGTAQPVADTSTTDASVTTGDATAGADASTAANTNTTTADTPAGTDTTVDNTNDADASNTVAVLAASGDNAAAGSGGSSVTTGSATGFANVVNVINTNIFDANGLLYFLNVLAGNVALDLRSLFSVLSGGVPTADSCTLASCTGGDTTLTINNDNSATVSNDVSVTASTGNNSATASSGSATVTTGNAYASANVVNVVNTNLTDSNYLILAVNNFGSMMNDIVFPGAEWFTNLFHGSSLAAGSNTTVTNTNTAAVDNTVDVGAGTGGNDASGTSAVIATGDAHAAATVVNQVNTNIFGDSLLFLFRIHGSWAGDVFGLPDGVNWRQTDDGVELFLSPSGGSAPFGSTDYLNVNNTNTATVTNNVNVYALTGDNKAAGGTGSSSVATGDAYASANVVNVVNTNVLGRNWVLAIFNIFGDWTGNISFGQPDLWVGARAVVPSSVRAGSCFNYEVTVNNLGDAAATNVVLDGLFDKTFQQISGLEAQADGRMQLRIGSMRAGGTYTVTLPTCLTHDVPSGATVETSFVVDARETDADTANNTEAISVVTAPSSGGSALRLGPAKLSIDKVVSKKMITASSSVDYTIVVTNSGDPVYNALLVDTIYDANHKPVHEQRWGLETIHAQEQVIIKYTAFFNASTTPGIYTNEAFISGVDRNPDFEHNLGNPVDSPTASADLVVTAQKEAAPAVCVPLLSTYIKYGEPNDATEVDKLQFFLRTLEHDDTVSLTGVFDDPTFQAVHAFQRRYAADILDPWGITQTTGFVYYTTQKKINELWCNDRSFPLTSDQQIEIKSFRTRVHELEQQGQTVPASDLGHVGMAPQSTGTTLAEVVPAPAPTNTDAPASDQVAAASAAMTNTAVTGIWDRLRERLAGVWTWVKF
jgi:hypothetical protein